MPNGTLCCSSLDQVRAGIDDVDSKLLELLALRSAYGIYPTSPNSNYSRNPISDETQFKSGEDVNIEEIGRTLM